MEEAERILANFRAQLNEAMDAYAKARWAAIQLADKLPIVEQRDLLFRIDGIWESFLATGRT